MSEDRQPAEQSAQEDADLEIDEQEPEVDEDVAEEDGDGGGDDGSDSEAQEGQGADGAARHEGPPDLGRRGGRANQRIQQLSRERDEARAREQVFQQQLNQLLQRTSVEDQRAAEAAEAERLKYMAPEERISYETNKIRQEMQAGLQQTQRHIWDRSDAAEYERAVEANPAFRKFESRVAELKQLSDSRGLGLSRLDLLDKAMGEAMRKNMGASRTRQERKAETSQRQQQTRPPGGASNVASPRQRSGARQGNFEHMRNVTI